MLVIGFTHFLLIHTHTNVNPAVLTTALKSMYARFRANEINQIIHLRLVKRHCQVIYTDQL